MRSKKVTGFIWFSLFNMLTIPAIFRVSAVESLNHQDQGLDENAESRNMNIAMRCTAPGKEVGRRGKLLISI